MLLYTPETKHEEMLTVMQTHCGRVLSCDVSIDMGVMTATWDGQVWLLKNIGLVFLKRSRVILLLQLSKKLSLEYDYFGFIWN